MTDPVPDDGWPARLDKLLAGARRRRDERRKLREDFATARTAGLRQRHTRKLARTDEEQTHPTDRKPMPREEPMPPDAGGDRG